MFFGLKKDKKVISYICGTILIVPGGQNENETLIF